MGETGIGAGEVRCRALCAAPDDRSNLRRASSSGTVSVRSTDERSLGHLADGLSGASTETREHGEEDDDGGGRATRVCQKPASSVFWQSQTGETSCASSNAGRNGTSRTMLT